MAKTNAISVRHAAQQNASNAAISSTVKTTRAARLSHIGCLDAAASFGARRFTLSTRRARWIEVYTLQVGRRDLQRVEQQSGGFQRDAICQQRVGDVHDRALDSVGVFK